jgi:hypothetical protein
MAADAGLKTYVFTANEWISSYEPLVTPTNGRVMDINMSTAQMELELDKIVNQCY